MKNKTGHYIKAFDSFISNGHEVYKIIEYLFAGEEAQATRYDKMANFKIRVWNVLWLSDADIYRPLVMKKVKGKKKEVLEGEQLGNVAEIDETEDGEKINTLQEFHGVGTRGLFYFYAMSHIST